MDSAEGSVPVLLIPRSEMDLQLKAQVDLGSVLARHPRKGTWEEWHKRNLDLLNAGFSTSQVAGEYEAAHLPMPDVLSTTILSLPTFRAVFMPETPTRLAD